MHPEKSTYDSDMYNRAFPVGRKGSTSILPALHLLRHAIRSCCQRIKYANCYHTQRKRKIRTLLQSEIGSDFSCLVGAGGFEPPKLKSSRFTVCPHWPLGNTPRFCSRPLPDDLFILSDCGRFVNYFFRIFAAFLRKLSAGSVLGQMFPALVIPQGGNGFAGHGV